MRKKMICVTLAACALATVPLASASADPAPACSDTAVTARGEPAAYAWMAKIKARANWRRKVRELPNLGPAWSNWYRAAETEERCLIGPGNTLCIFTGTPCKQ